VSEGKRPLTDAELDELQGASHYIEPAAAGVHMRLLISEVHRLRSALSESETVAGRRLELLRKAHDRGEPSQFVDNGHKPVKQCAWCNADKLRADHASWCPWRAIVAEIHRAKA
jgi:hypothetical protein